jgi:hypothetical protein
MTLTVFFPASPPRLSWTPTEDVRITGMRMEDGIDVAVGMSPTLDVSNYNTGTDALVTAELISYISAGGANQGTGFFPVDALVPRGESVFFSADGSGVLSISFQPVAE